MDLILQPTSTAQWHALVNEAEASCALELGEDLESYLVFLLMRFAGKPEFVKSIIALEFLESIQTSGQIRNDRLREIGDKCLLFSGLFPGLAKRKRVNDNYFIVLGQRAYYTLAILDDYEYSELYALVCKHFTRMKDVLQAMRNLEQSNLGLDEIDKQKLVAWQQFLSEIIKH